MAGRRAGREHPRTRTSSCRKTAEHKAQVPAYLPHLGSLTSRNRTGITEFSARSRITASGLGSAPGFLSQYGTSLKQCDSARWLDQGARSKKSGHQPPFKKIGKHKISLSCLEPNPKADGADGIFV